jgi:mannose/cellobiose epimerase-like protein (N-acyl-D-glucosamine 2-epimerase family)
MMKSKMSKPALRIAFSLAIVLLAWSRASAQALASKMSSANARAPQNVIDQHLDPKWLKSNMMDLLDHWRDYSMMPNGLINLNLERTWLQSTSQIEAGVESQGRQMNAMVIGYEYSQDKRYLEVISKAFDFLMKMHDDQYGGFYFRTNWEGKVIDDTKSFIVMPHALSALSNAYRVTKDPKYLKPAMDLFHTFTTKMRDGQFFQASLSRDFSKPQAAPYFGGAGSPFAGLAHHRDWPNYGPAPAGAGGGGSRTVHTIHIQALESFLDLYEATQSKEVWDEITAELNEIAKLYDYKLGYMPNSFDADWKASGNSYRNLPPGLNEGARFYQWASLFSKAVALGADPKFIELGSRGLDLGLKLDFNKEVGGSGGVDEQGRPIIMFWWSQCELLKAVGQYAAMHGRSDLWPYYDKTLAFVKKNHVDPEYGGWFEGVVPGWSRAKLAEVSVRAYIKGSLDGSEFDAHHQALMFRSLLTAAQPSK